MLTGCLGIIAGNDIPVPAASVLIAFPTAHIVKKRPSFEVIGNAKDQLASLFARYTLTKKID